MIVARTVEQHTDGRGSYWLAAGEAYGRMVLAEGATRQEAVKAWTQGAADRQATLTEMQFRGRRVL